jgi:hypothetical protein
LNVVAPSKVKAGDGDADGGAGHGGDGDVGREMMARRDAVDGDAAGDQAGHDPRPDLLAVPFSDRERRHGQRRERRGDVAGVERQIPFARGEEFGIAGVGAGSGARRDEVDRIL